MSVDATRRAFLQIAYDEERVNVRFDGTKTEVDSGFGYTKGTHSHKYKQEKEVWDRGILYITDPAVEKELEPYLRELNWYQKAGGGKAQRLQDKELEGAARYQLTVSAGKALESAGVKGYYTDACVYFHDGGSMKGKVEDKQRGGWFDQWWATPEFEDFWRTELGERWAYIWDSEKERRLTIPFADKKKQQDSETVSYHTGPPM